MSRRLPRSAERRRHEVEGAFARGASRRSVLLALVGAIASLPGIDAKAAERVFDLRLAEGQLPAAMRLIRVMQGDVVKLRWSTDRPMTLHLHGYDIELRVEPGSVAEMRFTARATGRFPVGAHAAGAARDDAHGEAALLHVEVYPR